MVFHLPNSRWLLSHTDWLLDYHDANPQESLLRWLFYEIVTYAVVAWCSLVILILIGRVTYTLIRVRAFQWLTADRVAAWIDVKLRHRWILVVTAIFYVGFCHAFFMTALAHFDCQQASRCGWSLSRWRLIRSVALIYCLSATHMVIWFGMLITLYEAPKREDVADKKEP
jgi:hypothetical protein